MKGVARTGLFHGTKGDRALRGEYRPYGHEFFLGIPTVALVEELQRRDGVETYLVDPGESLDIRQRGPAIVLAVID